MRITAKLVFASWHFAPWFWREKCLRDQKERASHSVMVLGWLVLWYARWAIFRLWRRDNLVSFVPVGYQEYPWVLDETWNTYLSALWLRQTRYIRPVSVYTLLREHALTNSQRKHEHWRPSASSMLMTCMSAKRACVVLEWNVPDEISIFPIGRVRAFGQWVCLQTMDALMPQIFV